MNGYRVGQSVDAFHPRMLGVVKTGKIVTVGRKYLRVDFGPMLGGILRVRPHDVVGG